MPSFLHHPGYQDFPLRLTQGLWLHSSRWEPTDFQYFAEQRKTCSQQVFAAPKLYRHKRKKCPTLDGQWIFKPEEASEAAGWAELQSFPSKNFGKGLLIYSLDLLTLEAAQEALVSLTSLVFTLSRNDHLQILSATASSAIAESVSHVTGTMQTIMSLPVHPWHPNSGGFHAYSCLAVDRSSWRSCPELFPAMRQLKHLEMRIDRLDKLAQGKARRKRPFLARLFKPKVDDSIF